MDLFKVESDHEGNIFIIDVERDERCGEISAEEAESMTSSELLRAIARRFAQLATEEADRDRKLVRA